MGPSSNSLFLRHPALLEKLQSSAELLISNFNTPFFKPCFHPVASCCIVCSFDVQNPVLAASWSHWPANLDHTKKMKRCRHGTHGNNDLKWVFSSCIVLQKRPLAASTNQRKPARNSKQKGCSAYRRRSLGCCRSLSQRCSKSEYLWSSLDIHTQIARPCPGQSHQQPTVSNIFQWKSCTHYQRAEHGTVFVYFAGHLCKMVENQSAAWLKMLAADLQKFVGYFLQLSLRASTCDLLTEDTAVSQGARHLILARCNLETKAAWYLRKVKGSGPFCDDMMVRPKGELNLASRGFISTISIFMPTK